MLFLLLVLEKVGLRKVLEGVPLLGHLYMVLAIPLSWVPFAISELGQIPVFLSRLFPMGGERSLPELYALATTAARNGMTLIEPTGGIDLDNFSVILKTCLEAGVPRIMPHVYSSIIDPDTGYTRPDDVAVLLNKVKSLL